MAGAGVDPAHQRDRGGRPIAGSSSSAPTSDPLDGSVDPGSRFRLAARWMWCWDHGACAAGDLGSVSPDVMNRTTAVRTSAREAPASSEPDTAPGINKRSRDSACYANLSAYPGARTFHPASGFGWCRRDWAPHNQPQPRPRLARRRLPPPRLRHFKAPLTRRAPRPTVRQLRRSGPAGSSEHYLVTACTST